MLNVLSRPDQLKAVAAADKAVGMLWFVHGLAFDLIGSRLFCDAVEKIEAAPAYKPCHRTTLSTSHLSARNAKANEFKIILKVGAWAMAGSTGSWSRQTDGEIKSVVHIRTLS